MKKMKKKFAIALLVVIAAVILFVPIRQTWDDGGTVTYSALTYKVVCWNRLVLHEDRMGRYVRTQVYVFPTNFTDPFEEEIDFDYVVFPE